jgi:glycosyltransferase involved in cell wall biosynthesis
VFPYRFNLFYVNADQTPVVHGALGGSFCAGRYNIGCWAWELEEFPDRWLPFFEFYQEIWTPSAFCQDAISRKSPIPVLRVPYAVEVDVPRSMSRADFGLPSGAFVFLTIFDMLSVFERKNPLAVVEAFVRAFGDSSACHLAVKVNHGHLRPDQVQRLRAAAAGYPVTILDHAASREEINALMLSCDCLVSLHRSEGFGLTLAEAMCLGKPVIATAYSGNLDFTKSDNAFLVGYRLRPVGKGCEPYDEGLMWAEPSIEEAAAQMKAVYECEDLRQRRAMAGQEFVREFFSPAAVGRHMRNRLEAVRSRIAVDASPATPAPPASSEK